MESWYCPSDSAGRESLHSPEEPATVPSRVSPKPIMNSPPPPPPSKPKRILAGVLLGLLLIQVLSFYFGLMIPVNHIMLLWNKTVEERRTILNQPGGVIKGIGDRLPLTARVYLMDPVAVTHKNTLYYFYPREVSITMTDACYEGGYDTWNERPSSEWLVAHHFTYVLDYKQGTLTAVQPDRPPHNDTP